MRSSVDTSGVVPAVVVPFVSLSVAAGAGFGLLVVSGDRASERGRRIWAANLRRFVSSFDCHFSEEFSVVLRGRVGRGRLRLITCWKGYELADV